jgi:hypothetical protein
VVAGVWVGLEMFNLCYIEGFLGRIETLVIEESEGETSIAQRREIKEFRAVLGDLFTI